MEMGEEGLPQGVEMLRDATRVKEGRFWMPVPPITAMWTGPEGGYQPEFACYGLHKLQFRVSWFRTTERRMRAHLCILSRHWPPFCVCGLVEMLIERTENQLREVGGSDVFEEACNVPLHKRRRSKVQLPMTHVDALANQRGQG